MNTKIITIATIALLATVPAFASGKTYRAPRTSAYRAPSATPVLHRGYVTKSGAYVAPHYQTAPNGTKVDNWSSRPNVNPYTGKPGTKDPYAPGH
jgi:hypothetical protein